MENRWSIYDDEGDIFQGTEEEMRQKWKELELGEMPLPNVRGDIRLAQIHAVMR